MSKAITERQEDRGPARGWGPGAETAPSVLREDEPTVARYVGLVGASCVIFGGLALLLPMLFGWGERVGYGKAATILALGVIGLLSHAAYDRDLQVRRLYWAVGGVGLFFVGAMLCVIPFDGNVGGLFGVGFPCLGLALLFLLATLHHESDPFIRKMTLMILGGGGALGAGLTFLLGNNFKGAEFLVPNGALLGLMALFYLTAFIIQVGVTTDQGYRAALAVGAVGLLAVLIGLLRAVLPPLFYSWGWLDEPPAPYLVPWGLIMISLGLLYALVSFGLWSETPLVVLIKRELAAYFYSPLLYLVLVGMTVVAWFSYWILVSRAMRTALQEPIIADYFLDFVPILAVSFIVPVLTMRLLSEERRTGSLEHLLTAPVGETTVVLAKFLAAFILFQLLWMPFWLYLIALRVAGRTPFDYSPVFSFMVVLAVTGAAFVSMGVFCSSLTNNQVASAVLTFAGMILYFGIHFAWIQVRRSNPTWAAVTEHMNYIKVWADAMQGYWLPRFVLFPLSMTAIWLFLTVKVLEARRWA